MKLDLNVTNFGDFKNISLFETKSIRTIECTTSVYSFGKRILETKELQQPQRCVKEDSYFYQFDFVRQFFTVFLNGFKFLECEDEAKVAIENLTIMQVKKKSTYLLS